MWDRTVAQARPPTMLLFAASHSRSPARASPAACRFLARPRSPRALRSSVVRADRCGAANVVRGSCCDCSAEPSADPADTYTTASHAPRRPSLRLVVCTPQCCERTPLRDDALQRPPPRLDCQRHAQPPVSRCRRATTAAADARRQRGRRGRGRRRGRRPQRKRRAFSRPTGDPTRSRRNRSHSTNGHSRRSQTQTSTLRDGAHGSASLGVSVHNLGAVQRAAHDHHWSATAPRACTATARLTAIGVTTATRTPRARPRVSAARCYRTR